MADPFAEDFSASSPEPAAPTPANDPFAEDFNGIKLAPGSTRTGAFARGAARGALPAIGSLPAIGTGAAAGAEIGALFGPAAPVTVPLGGFIGGVAGGFGGAYALSKAQDWALSKFPDSWREKIGMDDRQQQLDEKFHGTASFLGGLAPYAVAMRPGLAGKAALPENATALQKIMANRATSHVFSGGVVGGLELGQEMAHGESPDWSKVAIATGFGVVFNRPTRIGESLTRAGERPVLRLVGKPEPAPAPAATPPEAEPAPEAAPAAATTAAPAEAVPAAPKVSADAWRAEMLERTRTGRPYDLPPTVADAADLKVMGPGITEEVFRGSHQQSPDSEQSAREAKQIENSVIGEPPTSDVHSVARQMHLDLFGRYDALRAQESEFARWAAEEPESAQAQQHLAAVRDELAKVQPEVAAAYRRAAEVAPAETVEPEAPPGTVGSVPFMITRAMKADLAVRGYTPEQIADMKPGDAHEILGKPPARTIEEQRDFIRSDVSRKLIRAGRPRAEAEAAGELIAARAITRAALFKGARGTAEDLYRSEGAEILGPGMRSETAPFTPRGPRSVDEQKLSLTQFLAHNGGIEDTPDTRALFGGTNPQTGFGPLIRKNGKPLDLIAKDGDVEDYIGKGASVRELTAAIDGENRGRKVYRPGMEPREALDPNEIERGEREAAEGGELSQREVEKQTETPEFKNWFGDSKVVDEEGKPLVVYHGTGDLVTEFDLDHPNRHDSGWLGRGVYMTTDPRLSDDYAFMKSFPGREVGPNVMPLFAKLENPYYATAQDKVRLSLVQHNEGAAAARVAAEDWTEKLKAAGYDGVIREYPSREIASQAKDDPASRAKFWASETGSREGAIAHIENVLKQAKAYPKNFDARDLEISQQTLDYLKSGGDIKPETVHREIVVFDPAGVKSAIGNRGTFDPNDPGILYQKDQAPPFYSAVARAVTSTKLTKGSPEQWLGTLRNTPGVKPEELDWLGLEDWLKEQKGSVTKEQVADYVRANQIEVREVQRGEISEETQRRLDDLDVEIKRLENEDDPRWRELSRERGELLRQVKQPKFGPNVQPNLSLPGGENYRELLLTLPEKPNVEADAAADRIREISVRTEQIQDEFNEMYGKPDSAELAERRAALAREKDELYEEWKRLHPLATNRRETDRNFRSSHFEEPNIVAHVRFNDRVIDGKRTLHIEEVQSDWHQQGKKKGYQEPPRQLYSENDFKFSRTEGDQGKHWFTLPDGTEEPGWGSTVEAARAEALKNYQLRIHALEAEQRGRTVPDAPFKTTWPELAMKRMIRYAAENGYDKISWTTGETQAERYDLSKQVDNIRVTDQGEGKYTVGARRGGQSVIHEVNVPTAKLPDMIGKELADKALTQLEEHRKSGSNKRFADFEGPDLKVGGEGMKGFYDQILPATVNKLVKKFGGKVGKGEVDTGRHRDDWQVRYNEGADRPFEVYDRETRTTQAAFASRDEMMAWIRTHPPGTKTVPVHTLDITDKLRETATDEGFALFQRQRPGEPSEIHQIPGFHIGSGFLSPNELYQIKAYHGSPHDFDKFDISYMGTGEGAQAYGAGHYLAESEAVAKGYRESTKGNSVLWDGKPMAKEDAADLLSAQLKKELPSFGTPTQASQWITSMMSDGRTLDEVRRAARGMAWEKEGHEAVNKALDIAARDNLLQPNPGHLYTVAIKADPEHFLDWDKPLSEQSEHVQNVMKEAVGRKGSALAHSGEWWHNEFAGKVGGDYVSAANALRQAGIPGIKYLDQQSRGPADVLLDGKPAPRGGDTAVAYGAHALEKVAAGDPKAAISHLENLKKSNPRQAPTYDEAISLIQGGRLTAPGREKTTSNYVVFDDKLIDITHKDGTPVTDAERKDITDSLFQDINQGARGKIRLNPQGVPGRDLLGVEGTQPIMRLMASANASTFIHESGHQFLGELMRDAEHEAAPDQLKADAQTTLKWLGVEKAEDIGVRHQEKFARGFEQYLREGVAPSSSLARVFAQFRQWLVSIYQTLKGLGAPISEDIRGVFDRMLAEEPQRTVIAPERETPGGMADVHEEDAAMIAPEHADAVEARVAHERETRYANHPNATEIERASPSPAELGGEAGGGAGGLGEVQPRGEPPASEPGSGGVGAGNEPQLPSVNPSPAQGDRMAGRGATAERPAGEPSDDARAHLDDHPLAPGPTVSLSGGTFNVGKKGNIRTENITSVPQFMEAIEEAKERIPGTSGPMTNGQLRDAAEEFGFQPEDWSLERLMRAFGGVKDLDKKTLAFRMAVREQEERVADLVARVAETTDRQLRGDNDALTAELAKEQTRLDMFMSVLSSTTTEWGRAGRSFGSLDKWDEVMGDNLAEGVKKYTGKTLYQLKLEAKLAAQYDTPAKVAKFLRDASKRSFGGMILEYWINGLISGPATHTTYYIGNKLTRQLETLLETPIAAAIGAVRAAMGRTGERVYLGEVGARESAIFGNIAKRWQAGLEALRTGQPTLLPGQTARPLMPFFGDTTLTLARNIQNDPVTFHEVMGDLFGALKGARDGVVAGATLVAAGGHAGAPAVGFHYSPLGQIPDLAVKGVPVLPIGSAIRLPGRVISAIHSMDTASNYTAEIGAMAYREAVAQGKSGNDLASHMADRIQNPPDDWMQQAIKKAYAGTLMAPGGNFVKRLSALVNTSANLPGIGEIRPLKFIDPFVHIGANVITKAIVERTPLGILSSELRADLMGKNGNIAQDTAQARMLAGTALSLVIGGLAMDGYANGSGPSDPHKAAMWRLAGNQPHSIRIGDMWYQVNRLGPLGMLVSVAADMYDVAHDASKGDMLTAAAHLQHAVTQNILDESFMRGPSDLIRAVEDPGRYGEGYLRNLASSFVPFSVGMFQIARAADPYSRQARTVMDAIKNKVPGMSETLFPRRDIWGEELPNPEAAGGLRGALAIWEKHVSNDPVNRAMIDLGIAPAAVERKIRNVDLTDQEYDDFARTAGRMTKMRLDVIVNSPDWQTWPNHAKAAVIAEIIKANREVARGLMMSRYPHIPVDAANALRKKKTSDELTPIQ